MITKYDLFRGNTYKDERDGKVPEQTFKEVEDRIAEIFSMKGSLKQNCIRWISFVDGQNVNNPSIDNTALKFLHTILGNAVENRNETPEETLKVWFVKKYWLKILDAMPTFEEGWDRVLLWFLFAVSVLFLAVYISIMLNPTPLHNDTNSTPVSNKT